ncbi:MAG: hypothetical protein ABWX61_05950 [Paenisporosarcina sp.]
MQEKGVWGISILFKNQKLPPIILIVSMLLIFFVLNGVPFLNDSTSTPKSEDVASASQELKEVLQKIDGVGDVELYIYSGKESEMVSKSSLPTFSLFNEQANKEKGIQSILVVAAGADNIQVQNKLKQYLSSVFLLPEHRIVVVPMDEKGVLK